MWFTKQVSLDGFCVEESPTFHRVCYSCHSSYTEIRHFIYYLKPRKVLPNVIPSNETREKVCFMQFIDLCLYWQVILCALISD